MSLYSDPSSLSTDIPSFTHKYFENLQLTSEEQELNRYNLHTLFSQYDVKGTFSGRHLIFKDGNPIDIYGQFFYQHGIHPKTNAEITTLNNVFNVYFGVTKQVISASYNVIDDSCYNEKDLQTYMISEFPLQNYVSPIISTKHWRESKNTTSFIRNYSLAFDEARRMYPDDVKAF